MTRLELVQFVAQKLATEDRDEITSTTAPATDYIRDIVEAVDTAWLEIQIMHEGVWHWRREQQTLATVASTRVYTFADIDADCVGVLPIQHRPRGRPYILIDQHEVQFIPYQNFRGWLDRGTRSVQRPQYFTVRSDGGGSIELDPTPDQVYTIELDILHDVQALTADGTIPLMPARFHHTIAYLAARDMTEVDEGARYKTLQRQYTMWLNDLRDNQLPDQRWNVIPVGS